MSNKGNNKSVERKKKADILLVEDNPDDAFFIREALMKYDPNLFIDTVNNGSECLEKLSEGEYHAMILDYRIPFIDGISVLDEIKKRGYSLPVIMVTGFGNESIAVESMKKGLYDYVIKSHSYLEELPIAVSRALESHKLKKEKKKLERQLIQSEKMVSIGTLASGVAHEINNPLQGISTYAEMIMEMDNLPAIKEFSQKIMDLSTRIANTVSSLCHFSRNISQDEAASILLNEIIDEAIRLATLSPEFININIQKEYHASTSFKGNAIEITQVFVNLLNNAKDAMNGAGQLTIHTRDGDKFTETKITDTGSGISKDIAKQIFDPFFTTKDPGKGTGLGLSIAQRIVERHRGEIHMEDKAEKGATFTVSFPVST